MKTILEPIEIDANNPGDVCFMSWYEENRALTKDMVLLGYHIIKDGIPSFIQRQSVDALAEIEKLKKKHEDDLANEKSKHERAVKNTEAVFEETLKQLKASMNGIPSFIQQQSVDALAEIEKLKKRHEDDLANEKSKHERAVKNTEAVFEETLKQLKASVNVVEIKSILEHQYDAKVSLAVLRAEEEIRSDLSRYKALYEEIKLKYDQRAKEHETFTKMAVLQVEKDMEAKMAKEIDTALIEAGTYKALYEDVKTKNDNYIHCIVDNDKDREIERLTKAIQDTQQELNIMKKTNFAKGKIGENMIMAVLKQAFPSYEYCDVSKEKHAGDIHMISPVSNNIIMIESKNKETIKKSDVDKFYKDIAHLYDTSRKISCGLFISILTKNIPHIGEFKIEIYKGVPVVFAGFNDETDFTRWIHMYMKLAVELTSYQKHTSTGEENIRDVMKKLSPLIDQIKRLKNLVERLRNTHLKNVNNTVADLEMSVTKLFDTLSDVLSVSDALHVEETPMCHICSCSFNTKNALTRHMKVHNKEDNMPAGVSASENAPNELNQIYLEIQD